MEVWHVVTQATAHDHFVGTATFDLDRATHRLLLLRLSGAERIQGRPVQPYTTSIRYSRYGEHLSLRLPSPCHYINVSARALLTFTAQGDAMTPALHDGQPFWVNRAAYRLHGPQRGDVVVFRAVPAGRPDAYFVKRVIGLPGETVAVHNDYVWINGKKLNEPYIDQYHRPLYNFPAAKVPPNDYFVLGDNRNNSQDSHLWRWLPKQYIIGKAWISYWPPSELNLYGLHVPLTVGLPSVHLPSFHLSSPFGGSHG
jgi:signal peptidase I